MKKKELGQFYTTNSAYIFEGLLDIFPEGSTVIDAYSGNWDLLNLVKDSHPVEAYDIDPKVEGTIEQDTLLNPPDFQGKWVLTNPPYLAVNKTNNKTLFQKHGLDDLYKISLKTSLKCAGGAVVIPLNFFSNDRSIIREEFLKTFRIIRLNIFEEQVFDDTTYTVCSFSFVREPGLKEQEIDTYFYPLKEYRKITLSSDYNYMFGGDFFFPMLKENTLKITRLTKGGLPNSNLFLRAIDTGSNNGRISLSLKEPFFGIKSDRTFATIVFPEDMNNVPEWDQLRICEEFNKLIEDKRKKYRSLFLTNFRNSSKAYSRKRIGFDLAYGIISYIIRTKFPHLLPNKNKALF